MRPAPLLETRPKPLRDGRQRLRVVHWLLKCRPTRPAVRGFPDSRAIQNQTRNLTNTWCCAIRHSYAPHPLTRLHPHPTTLPPWPTGERGRAWSPAHPTRLPDAEVLQAQEATRCQGRSLQPASGLARPPTDASVRSAPACACAGFPALPPMSTPCPPTRRRWLPSILQARAVNGRE